MKHSIVSILFWRYLVAICFVVTACACINNETQIQSLTSELQKTYGINIHKLLNSEQLPASVVFKIKNGESVVNITQIDSQEFYQYLKIIKIALNKYPPDLVKENITDIYLGGPYREDKAVITGMYDKSTVFLFYNHPSGDNSNLFLEQTFHHEFSSILILKYDFPAFDWLELNPEDFSYIINPQKITKYMSMQKTYEADESLLKIGLVSTYGRVNAENDINTYVEFIFTEPDKFKQYVAKYPIIAKKYNMIKSFYLSISSQFQPIFDLIDS